MPKQRDDSIFDRLAKPRSGSQPPKSGGRESGDAPTKAMSTSFTKKSGKTADKVKKKSSTGAKEQASDKGSSQSAITAADGDDLSPGQPAEVGKEAADVSGVNSNNVEEVSSMVKADGGQEKRTNKVCFLLLIY